MIIEIFLLSTISLNASLANRVITLQILSDETLLLILKKLKSTTNSLGNEYSRIQYEIASPNMRKDEK